MASQPGNTAPSRPANAPAMAAAALMRDHSPSSTGTTAVAHNRSAIKNSRSTELPCSATHTTGTISATVNQRADVSDKPRFSVTSSDAMAFCRVSTDEATKVRASSNAGNVSQPGASRSMAKKGMGGEPTSAPLITVTMPRPPFTATTAMVATPPSTAPRPSAASLSAAHTRCQ